MSEQFTRAEAREVAGFIRARTAQPVTVGLILGSGLNSLADEVAGGERIPYAAIPHFVPSTVPGHVGQLVLGELAGQGVCIMQGRSHPYEGVPMQQAVFPIRVMYELGIRTLIVTNAAGGVNPAYRAGDLMLISDHIGLAGMVGQNPLIGPNDDTWGPRFVDMIKAYDPELRRVALRVAADLGLGLHQGVYCGLFGPTFETPAEVRMLRTLGADAVGMSTVAEVVVARHMGMRVLGVSGIANAGISQADAEAQVDHAEVLAAGETIAPRLMALLRGVLLELGAG